MAAAAFAHSPTGRTGAGSWARLLRGAGHGVQLSDHMESTDGDAMFRHACAMGLEGIVAKRRDKPYSVWPVAGLDQGQEPGRTSRDTVDRMIEGLTLAVLA